MTSSRSTRLSSDLRAAARSLVEALDDMRHAVALLRASDSKLLTHARTPSAAIRDSKGAPSTSKVPALAAARHRRGAVRPSARRPGAPVARGTREREKSAPAPSRFAAPCKPSTGYSVPGRTRTEVQAPRKHRVSPPQPTCAPD